MNFVLLMCVAFLFLRYLILLYTYVLVIYYL